ncbi:hypothetical protein GCM10009120_50100 [Sphingobacterium siyangense subsp. cladoniae]|uniref:YhhA family cyclophane-containing RiPP n=1 Tax=Sphingobacterium siyangense TaxID=459529 RepID=UPI0031F9821B
MDQENLKSNDLKDNVVIKPSQVDSEVLKRLLQEISIEKSDVRLHAYNRTHNRHNRGR